MDKAMQSWHKELYDYKVKIGVIFAYSDNVDKPAVKSSGYPVVATVRCVKGKDRVSKDFDVEMLVDAGAWRSLSSESKLAVVDHELAHVAIKKKKIKKNKKEEVNDDNEDKKGDEEVIVTDDHGRPVLTLKRADWNVGDGFADVVARHGKNAVEYLNIKNAESMAAQAMTSYDD
jgi:hypothetical protein